MRIWLEIELLIFSSLIPRVGASVDSAQCSKRCIPGNIRTVCGITPFLASDGHRFSHGMASTETRSSNDSAPGSIQILGCLGDF